MFFAKFLCTNRRKVESESNIQSLIRILKVYLELFWILYLDKGPNYVIQVIGFRKSIKGSKLVKLWTFFTFWQKFEYTFIIPEIF